MFNGSRFFNLLRKWKKENNFKYISILRYVINHYFDLLAGTRGNSSKLKIHNAKQRFSTIEITYVLNEVGYSNSLIEYRGNDAIVTLRNSL